MERANYPYLFAIIWLLIKAGIKYTGFYPYSLEIGIGLNLLFLPLIIFFAMKPKLMEKRLSSIVISKDGMKAGAKYAISIALAIFVYYQLLDPDFGEKKLEANIAMNEAYVSEQGGFEALKKSDPTLRDMTEVEYFQKQRDFGNIIYKPFTQASVSLFTLVILSVLYSFIVAILFKVIMR